MKEHPILFSGTMVKAILERRKTMTRRVIKQIGVAPGIGYVCKHGKDDAGEWAKCCAPYHSGDMLWVKETWRGGDDTLDSVWYRASGDPCTKRGHICLCKWRSPIFMPRKFSRINLKIISIGVERLQEITDDDAGKEGKRRALCWLCV